MSKQASARAPVAQAAGGWYEGLPYAAAKLAEPVLGLDSRANFSLNL